MCKRKTDRPSLKGIFKTVQVYRWQILTDSTYVFFLPTATFLVCLLAGAQYEHHATSCLNKFHWKYSCDYICSSRNPSVAIHMLDMRWKCLLSTPDLPGIQKWSIKKVKSMPRYTKITAMWTSMNIPFWKVDAWHAWFLSGVVFAVHCTNVLKSKKIPDWFSSFLEDRTGNERCVSGVF